MPEQLSKYILWKYDFYSDVQDFPCLNINIQDWSLDWKANFTAVTRDFNFKPNFHFFYKLTQSYNDSHSI